MSISQEGVKRSVLDAGLIMAYLGLNSTLNLLNRWALGIYGFRFPVFMTICHMLFSAPPGAPLPLAVRTAARRSLLPLLPPVVCGEPSGLRACRGGNSRS